jgi:hypothetical protein
MSMASIDTALYTRLSTFAGLVALASTRVYPPPAPQGATFPLVTYQQISGIRSYVYGNQSGFVVARFQLDSWAESAIGARALSEQVRLALSNYHGTSDTIVIDYISIESEQRLFEDDVELHRISQDYMVYFRETLPA